MAINYGAGFLPQNLYQNLFDIQRRGIEEERRRQMEPFRNLGSIAGKFAKSNIAQSKEAEDAFIKDMDEQIKLREDTLKDIIPEKDPTNFRNLQQEITALRQNKRQTLQKFRGSGFLGMGRDRDSLTIPEEPQGRAMSPGFIQLPGFENQISEKAYDPSGVKRKAMETKIVGDVTTDVLTNRERETGEVRIDLKNEEEVQKIKREFGSRVQITKDGRLTDIDGNEIGASDLKLAQDYNKILSQKKAGAEAGLQRIYIAGKGYVTIDDLEASKELELLEKRGLIELDKFKKLERARTDETVRREMLTRPEKIKTLKATLQEQRTSNKEEWENLGKEKLLFNNKEAIELMKAQGLVELANQFQAFGKKFNPITGLDSEGNSINDLKSQQEYNDLVDKLEAQSEVRLDEAEDMTAILNSREAGRLQVQLEANINQWEQLDRTKREEILQLEVQKAEELGDLQLSQKILEISTLSPLQQKQALREYKEKRLIDLDLQSGDRVREIIEKAGKDLTDEDLKTLEALGNTSGEKLLLKQYGIASRSAAKRQNEINKLALPDNVFSPRNKFAVAQREFNLPPEMTYENSQEKLKIISTLISSGQTPDAAMLESVGMGGMSEIVQKAANTHGEKFKKEALLNSLVGLVETSVSLNEDGKPDETKKAQALETFKALQNDPDTKALMDKFGYDESWFKGQSEIKLRSLVKELAGLKKTNSETAYNLARKSYTESQVPKLTPQERDKLERAKQFRSTVGQLIVAQMEEGGQVDMSLLQPAIKTLKMEYFPEMKEAERKQAGKAVVQSFLRRVPDGNKQMIRNVLNTMQLEIKDEELDEMIKELRPEPKKTKGEDEKKETKTSNRTGLTDTLRPPNTKPVAQLFYDITEQLVAPGSFGEYLFR